MEGLQVSTPFFPYFLSRQFQPGLRSRGGKPGEAMTRSLASGTFAGRKVALSGTSAAPAGSEKMIGFMADALKEKGSAILAGLVKARAHSSWYIRADPAGKTLTMPGNSPGQCSHQAEPPVPEDRYPYVRVPADTGHPRQLPARNHPFSLSSPIERVGVLAAPCEKRKGSPE